MSAEAKSHILLVDDSELVRESVRSTLEDADFNVTTLAGPFGLLKAIRELNPAVILLDIGLGGVDGSKLVELARRHASPATRILLYSAQESAYLDKVVALSGAHGYLGKHVVGDALARAVRRWVTAPRV
jgi:DNA-binding NarL/FixJ family response regulator